MKQLLPLLALCLLPAASFAIDTAAVAAQKQSILQQRYYDDLRAASTPAQRQAITTRYGTLLNPQTTTGAMANPNLPPEQRYAIGANALGATQSFNTGGATSTYAASRAGMVSGTADFYDLPGDDSPTETLLPSNSQLLPPQ